MPFRNIVYLLRLLGVTCVLACVGSAAQAVPVTIYDTMNNPWSVSWTDTRVSGVVDKTDRTDGNLTKRTTALTKTVNFDQARLLQPIILTFEQKFDAAVSYGGAAGNERAGLNFILRNEIANNTGVAWSGFRENLVDRDRRGVLGQVLTDTVLAAALGSASHPVISHFHTAGGSFRFDKDEHNNDLNNPAKWALNDPNSKAEGGNMLLIDDRINNPATSELQSGQLFIFNVQVHDIVVAGAIRRFDLIEQPIPEPQTLVLLALGLAGLVFSGRKRA